jgi:uncharacterized repeat protein (TIGR01451 family)
MIRVQTKAYRPYGHSRNEHSLWMAAAAFLLGLFVCQMVCGGQQASSKSNDDTNFCSNAEEAVKPTKKSSSSEPRPALMMLGGDAGFGSGPAIGSGIAQIVIEEEVTQNHREPGRISDVESDGFRTQVRILKPISDAPNPQPVSPQAIPTQKIPIHLSASQKLPVAVDYQQEPASDDLTNFGMRRRGSFSPVEAMPETLGYGMVYDPHCAVNPWHPNPCKDEAVFNGGDQGKMARVDSSWNIYNLNPEDTIGHFDTLDGRRLITPSNRVAIYAPRFAAVRKLEGLVNTESRLKVGSMDEKRVLNVSESQDFSTTTKQHLSLERFQGSRRASGLRETNRGVTSDNVIQLFGARNTFEAYENLSLFRLGMHQKSESARLGLGMQSANVWQDNLGVQVNVKGAQPVIVNDVYKVQQIVRIDSDDKHAILRVCKVASKISARPGESVDFTIRFDNLTGRPIGNVTIIDNLAGRLDYIADSAECSLKSNFRFERNEVGSLVLRWEIIDPMPANSGGIIRFRCRVQ